ncbi:radical SAM protein [Magnetovibrio sp. PR-2]|uniref:B12-binding domain-containing radical SAM protein n=1 Tax=Magnetovibrio sp. PR-2 TaxID=3120356 RepID=UPI002FCE620A
MELRRIQETCEEALRSVTQEQETALRSLRVLLIQPPEIDGVKSLLPHFQKGTKNVGFKPPLGLLSIASTLQDRSCHEIELIDAIAEELTFETLLDKVVAFRPDVIGITAWTDFWWPAFHTCEIIKQSLPHVHICVGGPHVGIYPTETLDMDCVDSVVVGDGEMPFLYLCNMVSHDHLINDFPGLHIAAGGVKTPPLRQFVQTDLDDLPMINRALLPISNYGSVLSKTAVSTTMITSRGCPYRCTFCKLDFQKNVARSADNVVSEFQRIADLGIREVEIYDDTFTWGKARLRSICEGLIASGNQVKWAVRDRVSSADPELYQLMYQAGCRRIHLGIESGVQSVLDKMKKRITLEQARFAIQAAREADFEILTYFLFGNAGESVKDMERTIEFSIELDVDYSEFSITIPYPGTEMYQTMLLSGEIEGDFWLAYAKAPVPHLSPDQVIGNKKSLAVLRKALNRGNRKFYYRPRYLIRELLRVSSFSELFRKMRMGARLARSVYIK